jgi:hypothetical protein
MLALMANPLDTRRVSLKKQGVGYTVALPLTLKSILRQKKNYVNSNISRCKNIFFKKCSKRNQNPSRYYNSITNLKFQHKPKYHLLKILILKKNRPIIYFLGDQNPLSYYTL